MITHRPIETIGTGGHHELQWFCVFTHIRDIPICILQIRKILNNRESFNNNGDIGISAGTQNRIFIIRIWLVLIGLGIGNRISESKDKKYGVLFFHDSSR